MQMVIYVDFKDVLLNKYYLFGRQDLSAHEVHEIIIMIDSDGTKTGVPCFKKVCWVTHRRINFCQAKGIRIWRVVWVWQSCLLCQGKTKVKTAEHGKKKARQRCYIPHFLSLSLSGGHQVQSTCEDSEPHQASYLNLTTQCHAPWAFNLLTSWW